MTQVVGWDSTAACGTWSSRRTLDAPRWGCGLRPRSYAHNLDKLQRAARVVSRRRRGSARHTRATRSLARVHLHVASQRRWWLHQVSSQLVQTHDRLVLETLATANLLGNHRLARAISDAGWAQLARQLTYKQAWRDGQVRLAPRWLASSKTCSACGHRKATLSLRERTYTCQVCGLVCDRDLNAAANLAIWATTHPPHPHLHLCPWCRSRTRMRRAGSPTPVKDPHLSHPLGGLVGPVQRERGPTLTGCGLDHPRRVLSEPLRQASVA
jgi:transposase